MIALWHFIAYYLQRQQDISVLLTKKQFTVDLISPLYENEEIAGTIIIGDESFTCV